MNTIQPLDLKDLCARIKLKRSAALSRWNPKSKYFDPSFPKPFRLGEGTRKLYWVESEVNAWLNAKAVVARVSSD